MQFAVTEASYPLNFRHQDVKHLEEHLDLHHSIQLVGMKRVGINNFIRFFLSHKNIEEDPTKLYIPIDLYSLVEREILPFWRLTFKRITDAVRNSSIEISVQNKIVSIFESSIQYNDLFLTYDGIRESMSILAQNNISPIIFFTRFDRLLNVATSELFDNLKGLKNASDYKLSYIFTSFREFKDLLPKVYEEKSMMYFTDTWYVKPALKEDMKAIIFAFEKQYGLTLSTQIKELITKLSGGHVQYLQICLIILFELSKKGVLKETDVESSIVSDERITLQSEELWDSLNTAEQEIVKKVVDGKKLSKHDFEIGKYLWDIGLLSDKVGTLHVFSPLFIPYAKEVTTTNQTEVFEFTKKEMVLFQFLQERIGEVCEREKIIERVWPEYNEAGISDWSIDKLVARLREKISKQGNGYKIQTVRTRGYKLVKD